MFQFIFTLILSNTSFASGGLYHHAKEVAFSNPKFMATAMEESFTYKCSNYISTDRPNFYRKLYVIDCYNISKDIFKILDLYPFEVEKGIILPISFHGKLLEFAKNRNILRFLKFFNENTHSDRIKFLKTKIPELLSDLTTFEEFIAVLFQDTNPSHLQFLKRFASAEAYDIISKSNTVFFESLSMTEERRLLFDDEKQINNPYHFYVIRYLSLRLSNNYSYQMSAFISYLFNYSYELYKDSFQSQYLFTDPDGIEKRDLADIISGLQGAYYKEKINFASIEKMLRTSNKNFLRDLAHRIADPH